MFWFYLQVFPVTQTLQAANEQLVKLLLLGLFHVHSDEM